MNDLLIKRLIDRLWILAERTKIEEFNMLIVDNKGQIIKCSHNIESILRTDNLVGRKWDEIREIWNINIDIQEDIQENDVQFYDFEVRNEKIFIKEVNLTNEEYTKVQFWHTYGMMKDLQRATQENKMLKSMLDYQGITVCDLEGKIIYINDEGEKTLGVNAKSVMNQNIKNINSECIMESVAQTCIPRLGKIMYLNGRNIPILIFPLIIDGEIKGTVARSVFADINEAENYIKKFNNSETVYKLESTNKNNTRYTFDDIIGVSKAICYAKEMALQASQSDASVLLLGETGTGKELFAHAIHSASLRSNMPFVRVNCASIPESLLESELFGYESGSFTGAKKGGKQGKFEIANRGTLFLDEIGDMNLNMQSKLLRVLQEGEIDKIGKTGNIKVDVRIIAATNRDLAEMVRNGTFREDLYYRLDVIRIDIPPLRHRKVDIEPIVNRLVTTISLKYGKKIEKISQEVLDIFIKYFWPGNVRELANVIEGTMCLLQGNIIEVSSLPANYLQRFLNIRTPICNKTQNNNLSIDKWRGVLDDELEEEVKIKKALEITSGNKRQAAVTLGVARSTFYEKLKKYGIN